MKKIVFLLTPLCLLILMSCGEKPIQSDVDSNPQADGFNVEQSDAAAIKIADEVMRAMGGRKAWDDTRYIKWTFFGRRTHIWDKLDQKVTINVPDQQLDYSLNMKDMTGTVTRNGVAYEADSLQYYLEQAHKMWINDSYWLVMPYKLKDSGVTLKYMGQDTTTTGMMADVLEVTFANVGVTPDNKYNVYVDPAEHLVRQWDYYANYQDSLPRFQSSWPNYKKYDQILLSGGQIGDNKITDIAVSQTGFE